MIQCLKHLSFWLVFFQSNAAHIHWHAHTSEHFLMIIQREVWFHLRYCIRNRCISCQEAEKWNFISALYSLDSFVSRSCFFFTCTDNQFTLLRPHKSNPNATIALFHYIYLYILVMSLTLMLSRTLSFPSGIKQTIQSLSMWIVFVRKSSLNNNYFETSFKNECVHCFFPTSNSDSKSEQRAHSRSRENDFLPVDLIILKWKHTTIKKIFTEENCCCRVTTKRHVTTSIRKLKPAKPMILLKLYLFFVICKYTKPVRSAYAHTCTHQHTSPDNNRSFALRASLFSHIPFARSHCLSVTATNWRLFTPQNCHSKMQCFVRWFRFGVHVLLNLKHFLWIILEINTLSRNTLISELFFKILTEWNHWVLV